MDNEGQLFSERQLLAAIADGNIEAFNEFFELHKERVFHAAFKMTRSAEVSEELSQEFFLKMWDKRAELVAVQNPGGYVYMSVYYMAIDYLRRKGNEARILELKRMASNDYSNDTQERVDERQLRGYIEKAAMQLPEMQQKVFKLRYHNQESYDDISAELGITRATAQSYFYQAIKFIREYIDSYVLPNAGMVALVFVLHEYI